MAHRNEFIEYLLELLQGSGEIKARAMFGGFGLYFYDPVSHQRFMFALVADEVLYFKTDEINLPAFEERGLEAFSYERSGKFISMSYNEAPGEVLDDPEEMAAWAGQAIEAARRNMVKKRTK